MAFKNIELLVLRIFSLAIGIFIGEITFVPQAILSIKTFPKPSEDVGKIKYF